MQAISSCLELFNFHTCVVRACMFALFKCLKTLGYQVRLCNINPSWRFEIVQNLVVYDQILEEKRRTIFEEVDHKFLKFISVLEKFDIGRLGDDFLFGKFAAH